MKRMVSFIVAAVLAACVPTAAPPEKVEPEARDQVRTELGRGNFSAALAQIARQVERGRPEGEFAAEYPPAINGVLAQAADQLAGKRYDLAGPLLRQALNAYPRTPELARRVARPATAVHADLQLCTDRLMEQGLLAYRSGRLEEAIAIWKRLLAFNPDHHPARQAVETASVQLRNLRSIEKQ